MKPDFVFKNEKGEYVVLETKGVRTRLKTQFHLGIKTNLNANIECLKEYLKAEPKVYLTIINIHKNDYPLLLHIPYKPSDVRWKNILNIIKKL